MAKQSSVNLDITNNPDGFDISGGTTLRKLSVTGGSVTIAGSGSATVTFPTTSTTVAGLGIAQSFTALQTFSAGISASGATFSGNISAPNIVNSLNGFTGAVQVTGSGAILQTVSGTTTTFGARLATTSLTGVASFNATQFTVSAGAVDLAAAYQATGDTVITVAGSGIGISTSGKTDTLFNIGVTAFNGLTGTVSLTGDGGAVQGRNNNTITARLASTSLTGVASFDQRHFAIGASGHVSLTGSYQVTGNTVVSGGASQLVSVSGNIATIDNRIATASVTGVASFGNEFVVVSGAVGLTSNYVKSINGATGAITNVAKTNVSNDFTSSQQFSDLTVTGFSSGSTVILNSPTIEMGDVYQVGDSVRLIIDNGAVGIYAYGTIYQSGGVGIQSDSLLYAPEVNATQFFTFPNGQTATSIVTTVNGATGPITNVAKTDTANAFTALNTFNAGISASGATFANDIRVNGVNIGLGSGNVASNLGIGKGALSGNSGGLFNTAIGSGAMEIGTNSYSVAFGYNALNSCTGGGINNVALGSSTMTTIGSASNNVAIGANSSHSLNDGNYNISIGVDALSTNNNGSSNIAIGYQALYTNGYDLNASNNIAIGYQALYTNDEGQQNTAIGNEALRSIATTGSAERNTAIGYQAGRWKGATGTGVVVNRLNTANDSIFIGWRARSSADAQTNQIVIGSNTLGGGSNTTTIGTTGTIDATIYGKLHGTNGVSGPTASFTSLTVSENTTLGNAATDTTTIHGAKIVNEGVYANGSLRTANISFANGQVQTLTGVGTGATGVTAIYFTGAPSTGAASVTAIITNGGLMTGAGMTSWGGNIKWPGGTKPLLTSSGVDVVSFVTPDAGTTIYGFVGGLGFS